MHHSPGGAVSAAPSTANFAPSCQPPHSSCIQQSTSWSSSCITHSPSAHPLSSTPLPHPNAKYAPTTAASSSSTMTELFVDTTMGHHHTFEPNCNAVSHPSCSPSAFAHAFRAVSSSPGSATAAGLMFSRFHQQQQQQQQQLNEQHQQWMLRRAIRHERLSSSSSDSGLPPSAGPFPLSPPYSGTAFSPCGGAPPSSSCFASTLPLPPAFGSSASLSPPGLSPLQIADFAFPSTTTTPSSVPTLHSGAATCAPAGTNRFRFDHLLPSPLSAATVVPMGMPTSVGQTVCATASVAAPPLATDGQQMLLKRMRHTSGTDGATALLAAVVASREASAGGGERKLSVCRSESLPTVRASPSFAANLAIWMCQVRQLNALLSPRLPAPTTTTATTVNANVASQQMLQPTLARRVSPPAEFVARELAAARSAALFRQQLETHTFLPPTPSSLRLFANQRSSLSSVTVPLRTGEGPPITVSGESVRKEIKQKLQLRTFKKLSSSSSSLSSVSCQSVKRFNERAPTDVKQQRREKQDGTERSEDEQQRKAKKKGEEGGEEDDDDEQEEGEEQFMCHICNKDFRRPDILSRHVRRHTGEKPFGCNWCGRFFSRSDHLRTHQRTHTNEKPYHCTECQYSARRRDVLTRHMGTRHELKAGRSFFTRKRRRTIVTAVHQQQLQKFQKFNAISSGGEEEEGKSKCSSADSAMAQFRGGTEDRMRRLLRAHLLRRKSRTPAEESSPPPEDPQTANGKTNAK